MEDLVAIGRVVRTQGREGGLRVQTHSEPLPQFLAFDAFMVSGVANRGGEGWHRVERSWLHQGCLILHLVDCRSMAEAERYVGAEVGAARGQFEVLPAGQYYWFEIEGLEVVTERGAGLGRVVEIFSTGSNDIYVVRGGGREWLLPAIHQVVRQIDLPGRRIVIDPLEGLLSDDED